MTSELFTIQQAAALINCHPNTLRKWDKNGTLSPIRIGKRKDRRYTREQLDQILYNHEIKTTEVNENEKNFKTALQNNNIIFFSQDRNLRFTWMYYAHPEFSQNLVLGKTEPEVLGESYSDLSLKIKQRIMQTGKPEKYMLSIINQGIKQTYEVRVQPTRDASGEINGITGIAIEILSSCKVLLDNNT